MIKIDFAKVETLVVADAIRKDKEKRKDHRAGHFNSGTTQVVAVTPDGRDIYDVPPWRWIIKSIPEFEVQCLKCGSAIRFSDANHPPKEHEFCIAQKKLKLSFKGLDDIMGGGAIKVEHKKEVNTSNAITKALDCLLRGTKYENIQATKDFAKFVDSNSDDSYKQLFKILTKSDK